MKQVVVTIALMSILLPLFAVPASALNCPSGTSQFTKIPSPPAPSVPVPYPVCIENSSTNKKLPMPPKCTPPKFPLYRGGGWSCAQ